MKTITIKLSEKSEKYFNEVMYSLDKGDGKACTQSEAINHCLESLSNFEATTEQDVLTYLGSLIQTDIISNDASQEREEHGVNRYFEGIKFARNEEKEAIEQLIEDYKRKVHWIGEMDLDTKNEEERRILSILGCYRAFISELEKLLKTEL